MSNAWRKSRSHRAGARRLLGALALLSAAAPAGVAQADTVSGTRSAELVERSHEIRVTLDHGHATLRVRRGLFNGGERHDQAELWIDVPTGAVATGLRTRGTLRGKPRWFDGELLEAELAAARYRELTGIGGYYPKDPALLSWRSQSLLALQVFPVAPDSEKQVEYTWTMPMSYEEGLYHVTLPTLGTDALTASYVFEPAHRGDQVFVDEQPVVAGKRVTPGGGELRVSLGRRDAPRLDARLGVVPVAPGRVLVRFALEGAREFSSVPDDAHVVVLVDASRSRDEADVAASYAAAHAYLTHFLERRPGQSPGVRGPRGARVELVSFDRALRRHTRGFEPVEKAMARLEQLDVRRGNGSAVDEALERAASLLARAPRGAPRRVVLLSDLEARASLGRARVEALSRRTGAIVHVGVVRDAAASVRRDDEHAWSDVARATGGLLWRAAADAHARVAGAEDIAAFEEWARPLRVDKLQVRASGLAEDALGHPDVLREGEGFAWFGLAPRRVRHVSVRGELWSEPVREVIVPSQAEGTRWSALAFGDELLSELSEAEMMTLAVRGHAVSPVTSYLAIEPGVRPSTEGLDWELTGTGLGFAGRGRRAPRVRQTRARIQGAPPDRQGFLERELASAWTACGGQGRGGAVALESTWREVVEVVSVTVDGAPEPVLTNCVREATWRLDLPEMFTQSRASWVVKV